LEKYFLPQSLFNSDFLKDRPKVPSGKSCPCKGDSREAPTRLWFNPC